MAGSPQTFASGGVLGRAHLGSIITCPKPEHDTCVAPSIKRAKSHVTFLLVIERSIDAMIILETAVGRSQQRIPRPAPLPTDCEQLLRHQVGEFAISRGTRYTADRDVFFCAHAA